MGIVVSVQELSKSRSKVALDNGLVFVLYKGEMRLFHIEVGFELTEMAEREILSNILPKRAKLRCMNLLKTRAYTEQQLCDKLKQGFYPVQVIEEAIEYVKSFHYVDDERYAEDYIAGQLSRKSKQRIRMDLLRKGIDREMIDRKLMQAQEDETNVKESELILRLLEKKHYVPEMSQSEKQKIYGFLLRRGFQSSDICQAMRLQEE
ncbi:MAG: regulatory protein RecX [Lachnospiraceae bacterium]|nr:regulatory protein RecX [Lachnospiraceae bacterium]